MWQLCFNEQHSLFNILINTVKGGKQVHTLKGLFFFFFLSPHFSPFPLFVSFIHLSFSSHILSVCQFPSTVIVDDHSPLHPFGNSFSQLLLQEISILKPMMNIKFLSLSIFHIQWPKGKNSPCPSDLYFDLSANSGSRLIFL